MLLLAFVTPRLAAQDYGNDKPAAMPAVAVPLTPEQKGALRAVDVRIAGVEALVAKVDDADYRATLVTVIADLKKRRAAMERNFDPGLYEVLMHSTISRYQVVALWLTPPRIPAPADKPVDAQKSAGPVEKKTQTKAASR